MTTHATASLPPEIYRIIAENSMNWVSWFSPDLKLRWTSNSVMELIGYTPEECLAMPAYPLPITHPDDAPMLRHLIEHADVAPTTAQDVLMKFIHKNGATRYFMVAWAKVFDAAGVQLGVHSTGRDVTDMVLAAQEKTLAEMNFSKLFGISPVGVCLVDAATRRIKDANEYFLRSLEWTRAETIGRTSLELGMWANDADRQQIGDALVQGRPVREYEAELRTKSGARRHAIISAEVVTLGGVSHMLVVAVDVTKEREMAAQLRASEERHRLIVETAREGVLVLDENFYIMFANERLAEMLGYSVQETMGRSLNDFVSPEDLHSHEIQLMERRLGVPGRYERRLKRKDGSFIWSIVSSVPLRAPDGKFLGSFAMLTDITAQKKVEAELRQYQEHLQKMSMELTLAEERQRHQLAVELHDSIGQMLSVAKLRLQQVCRDTASVAEAPELRQVLESINKAISASRTLMFELSPPVLYELGLEAALDWLAEGFERRYPPLLIEYHNDHQEKPLCQEVRVMLFQVARELLMNVVKHAEAQTAQVRIRRQGPTICLQVLDDGKGFDPLARTLADPEQLRGFGLFSIRERLRFIKAEMQIESTSGQGTKVTITVPLQTTPAETGIP